MKTADIDKKLIFAFCTYNRAERLKNLISAMRNQSCTIPFEILVINNNSQDNTLAILNHLSSLPGAPLKFVTETEQGIVAARNRAIYESVNSDILVFIDDDEIPLPGHLSAVIDAIYNEGADCVGGRVDVDFSEHPRPHWLKDDLLGFLAATDHGSERFWIENTSTPIWTANIAYRTQIFRDDPNLRFDNRYDRKGKGIGGGEDVIMFQALLERKLQIRYRPDMVVLHAVEPWRLHRRNFLKLHFLSGYKSALNNMPEYNRNILGIPPFLFSQAIRLFILCFKKSPEGQSNVRKAMNVSHTLGLIYGYFTKWKLK